jgi:hypothetical protein
LGTARMPLGAALEGSWEERTADMVCA